MAHALVVRHLGGRVTSAVQAERTSAHWIVPPKQTGKTVTPQSVTVRVDNLPKEHTLRFADAELVEVVEVDA